MKLQLDLFFYAAAKQTHIGKKENKNHQPKKLKPNPTPDIKLSLG